MSTLNGPAALLTLPEAAARLRVSLRTLRSIISAGKIAVIRVAARRVAISESDLAAFIASRREVSA